MSADITETVRAEALSRGFATVGFTSPRLGRKTGRELKQFIKDGMHGDMGWLARNAELRGNPQKLWGKAGSVVVVGFNYAPGWDPMANLKNRKEGNVSVYARNRDYHLTGKKMLRGFARWMAEEFGCRVKIFLDTAPVMEKPLAEKAGVGWQGKHTNLVSRSFGSWLFLGEIFTTLPLKADPPHSDNCGSCRACIEICPTNALAGGRINPKRCISYLTIEHKGMIATKFRRAMGNRIYGCDDCLAVCPWNKFAAPPDPLFSPEERRQPPLAELLELDEETFRRRFSGSAIKRLGRQRFLRNVLIAAANSGDKTLMRAVTPLLEDPSWLVRAAAVWALGNLSPPPKARSLKALKNEKNLRVKAEWKRLVNSARPAYNCGRAQMVGRSLAIGGRKVRAPRVKSAG